MLPEIKALEPELKQILYGCVEHVQATKAALYLSASRDLNEKTFELVTSYQYNDAARRVNHDNDDLIDRSTFIESGSLDAVKLPADEATFAAISGRMLKLIQAYAAASLRPFAGIA